MFCAKCGAELPEQAAFCKRCGWAVNAHPQSPAAAPPQNAPAVPEPAAQQSQRRGGVNMRRVLFDILGEVIGSFFAWLVLEIVGYWLGKGSLSGMEISYSWILRGCLFFAFAFGIKQALVTGLRIIDPEDTRYDIGSVQDEETNKTFEGKYRLFVSIADGAIIAAAIALSLYSIYSQLCLEYPTEMWETQQEMAMMKDLLVAEFMRQFI